MTHQVRQLVCVLCQHAIWQITPDPVQRSACKRLIVLWIARWSCCSYMLRMLTAGTEHSLSGC